MPDFTAGDSTHCDVPLQFEILEARCCLSVLGHAASPVDAGSQVRLNTDTTGGTGFSAGQQDDVRFAREQLGLWGQGQTVVVIDSGVAYDHLALGRGLGESHRVVGGWDFAEGDADPYDDAPGGLHGTHVAGILGSDDTRYPGMAPQVDLVALRVFDDHGDADFPEIEAALQWVHEQQHAFTHAISTVNLSLGSDWNSGQVPGWAILEDELRQLAQDGILVVASAGNDFAQHGQPGLTYPAASPSVIPVGSVNRMGEISPFSQRHERMLAALGEWVTSTAPDYLFGFNGITDDFTEMSGTSMAAPIVAGAGVLVREALQLVGASDQSLTAVQHHLFGTADWVFDAATQSSYRRLNLRDALHAVVGTDESSGAANPIDLGIATGPLGFRGVLQQVSDEDYLVLLAERTGNIHLEFDWHGRPDKRPQVTAPGMAGDGPWDIPVQAGQQIVLGILGHGGIGSYEVRVSPRSSTGAIPAAAPANISEYRVRWKAASTGSQTIVAELEQPQHVDELVVRSSGGVTLARIHRPGAIEVITVDVEAGVDYEAAVIGQRPTGQLLIQDGDGNRIGTPFPGTAPVGSAGGWAMRSEFVDWRSTTSAVDLDVVQQNSWQEWLPDTTRQNERITLQLARQLHATVDRFTARVDASWERAGEQASRETRAATPDGISVLDVSLSDSLSGRR